MAASCRHGEKRNYGDWVRTSNAIGNMTYQPPFSISSRAVSLVAEISALVERYVICLEQSDALKQRRANRIKTIHSSLAIEGNALSLKQVTDNPAECFRAAGVNVPKEIMNDQQKTVMHLIRTGQVGGPAMRIVGPILARMGIKV